MLKFLVNDIIKIIGRLKIVIKRLFIERHGCKNEAFFYFSYYTYNDYHVITRK